jgi:glutathione S-transferase
MPTLFHAPQSRSSRFLWLLEELNADCEIVYTDITRMDGSGAPDPNNPHPEKKVPALVHNGVLITESAAIAVYLTDLFPNASIGPQIGDPRRGPYLSWLAYYAGVIEPVVHFQLLGLDDNPVLTRTFRGKAEMDRHILAALERHAYLLGDEFTAADIFLASLGHWMRDVLPGDDIVEVYLARCNARPALAAAQAKDARLRTSTPEAHGG